MGLLPDTSVEKGRKLGLPPTPIAPSKTLACIFLIIFLTLVPLAFIEDSSGRAELKQGYAFVGRAGGPEVESAEPVKSQA